MKDYSFGNYICALRRGRGLSQFQLGTLVGVTDKAISKWENGDAKPKLATCIRLANVLEVPIDELLSCKEQNTTMARKDINKMNRELWKEAYNRLSIYGDNPPALCWSRLAAEEAALRETNAIQSFFVLGKIEEEAQKSNSVFFATNTVSSSFAAWLLGATKVNPLPAHYRCPKCGKSEFVPDVADGFDLPQKHCTCGAEFLRDGHNIPYEGYMITQRSGTYVELRVSEAFKPVAANVIQMFYRGKAELIPVKLMHGGELISIDKYIVLSDQKSKPALSEDGVWYVESEEYWNWQSGESPAISFTLVISEQADEIQTLLQKTNSKLPNPPELLTQPLMECMYQKRLKAYPFITDLLSDESVHNFSLLLKLDGFIHGTGTWIEPRSNPSRFSNDNNLFRKEHIDFREIPILREDIFSDISRALTRSGIQDKGLALQIMEDVGKLGRYASKGMSVNMEQMLKNLNLPRWYPEYLREVMYLFPKGHCVTHLMFDVILEWYRMNYPEVFGQNMVAKD